MLCKLIIAHLANIKEITYAYKSTNKCIGYLHNNKILKS